MQGIIGNSVEPVDVVLRDGATAHLRPARRDDRAALREFYRQLSPESRYFRFFGKPRVSGIVEDVVRTVDSDTAFTLKNESADVFKEMRRRLESGPPPSE
jgi:hypothetical protein